MSSALTDSIWVYILNSIVVVICLISVIFVVLQPHVVGEVVAVVAGLASSVATSLITIMLKSTGAEERKEDTMAKVAMRLLERLDEEITVQGTKVSIKRGESEMTVCEEQDKE